MYWAVILFILFILFIIILALIYVTPKKESANIQWNIIDSIKKESNQIPTS